MFAIIVVLTLLITAHGNVIVNRTDLLCSGHPYYNVSLTAYYPDFASDDEHDYLDMRGKKLRTLQNYLDGRDEYVTVAMDFSTHLPYGTRICVPELNEHFGKRIPLQVRDFGANLRGSEFTRLDICVRNEGDSYDNAVNRLVTVYV
ncbi:uncharacterized protein LOC107272429 isoform X2 [Cephus cinctus]|uniref:Uncharacterized protein LOC107272429 isoform X2 n=1 Tax=Cephus cinctus TaxID=211228 RepID=A0AAJ7C972_CEPCN|nr:uncharacterized protein LOC107272429 isoform X2 [Cephus cinctus]